MLKYTLCLIRNNDQWLLLNRVKKPQMGMWNGVGGKIEIGETPLQSVVRETFEETGIRLKEVHYAGNVIFQSAGYREGMYLFTTELPEGAYYETPIGTPEGILDWKTTDWILHAENRGVAATLRAYLPAVLEGKVGVEHLFTYENREIVEYCVAELEKNSINDKYTLPVITG